MKLNRDILLAAGTVVALVIAVVAAVLLFGGISSFSSAEKKLQASIRQLRMFYAKNPFPSEDNVNREKQNSTRLHEWYANMNRALREGEIAPDPADLSPSRFIQLYGTTSSALRKEAKEAGVSLPADSGGGFAFGFDTYHRGEQPAPADCPLLTQQLKIVDMLCRLLIEHDVDSLVSVTRQEVSAGKTQAAAAVAHRAPPGATGLIANRAPPGARPRLQQNRPVPRPGGRRRRTIAPTVPEKPLYEKQHFELRFSARERTVLEILNDLAENPAFVAVTSVKMTRPADDILKPEQTLRNVGEGSVPLAEMKGDDYPSSIERMVCGLDIEKPMDVTIKLNVYNFLEDR